MGERDRKESAPAVATRGWRHLHRVRAPACPSSKAGEEITDSPSVVLNLTIMTCRAAPAIFFFQAEDGIRDLTVTGVQTCALPIYRRGEGHRRAAERATGPHDARRR